MTNTVSSGSASLGGQHPPTATATATATSTTGAMSNKKRTTKSAIKVRASRGLFVVTLSAAAAVLAALAHHFVKESEVRLASQQFGSIADRALSMAAQFVIRQRNGPVMLGSIFAAAFPDAEQWPRVHYNGFERVSNNILDTTLGTSMGLLPIVTPQELPAFEDFCYNTVFATQYPNQTVAEFSFGKGAYGMDAELGGADMRYHDEHATSLWGSPYQVLTPFLYHSHGSPILMLNLHSVEMFGRPIDQVLQCSKERLQQQEQQQQQQQQSSPADDEAQEDMECSVLTDMVVLTGSDPNKKSGPSAIVIHPVYPENDPTRLVGVISSSIVWDKALMDVFSTKVSGVDCVLETETQVVTYEIIKGVPTIK